MQIFENTIHWDEQEILWEHWVMFPDWRYFIVDTHSCELFINLFCCWLFTEEEMTKYSKLIWVECWRLVDIDKFNNMRKILINNWFIQIQWRYITWAKLFYKEINKEQREAFKRMGINIDEAKQFLIQ